MSLYRHFWSFFVFAYFFCKIHAPFGRMSHILECLEIEFHEIEQEEGGYK